MGKEKERQTKQEDESRILQIITLIRESFEGSEVIYTQGSCVKFAMILKAIFPQGEVLYNGHAIFRIHGRTYDITGQCVMTNHIPLSEYGLLHSYRLMNLKASIYEN